MTTLLHVTTVPTSLRFLAGQIGAMRSHGMRVLALSSPGEALDAFGREHGIETIGVEMPRAVTPVHDLGALARLTAAIRRVRPDIVHAHTPKGGLLGTTAAALARVPHRIYHIKGLPFETAEGPMRTLLTTTERVSCTLATHVLCVSHGVRETAIEAGCVRPERVEVLGHGSSNGVDATGRFDPARRSLEESEALRADLGIPEDALVIGFVGRLVGDKGVRELAAAWTNLRERFPEARLLIIGPFEPRDPVPPPVRSALENDPRVHLVADMIGDIERYYALMHIVALPTYREGLPNVLLEAQAMRLPVVATRIPGCVEGSRDGETSLLVPVADAGALEAALERYCADPELRRQHGEAGRAWMLEAFRQEDVWERTYGVYQRLLGRRS